MLKFLCRGVKHLTFWNSFYAVCVIIIELLRPGGGGERESWKTSPN